MTQPTSTGQLAPFPWKRAWCFSTALWLALLVVDIGKDSLMDVWLGRPYNPGELLGSLTWWPLLILPTPFALRLAHAVRPGSRRWFELLLVHIPAALVFMLAHLGGTRLFALLRGALPPEYLLVTLKQQISSFFFFDMLSYTMLVAGYWAWDYKRRFFAAQLAVTKAQRLAAEARFEALRWQLNPHFLFNSLNAAAGLVRAGQPEAGVEMLARVSSLLRSTLEERDGTDVSLARELELVDLYTSIERVRFGERLKVELRVDNELLHALVPALILQPLVENAVRHGVSSSSQKVNVDIEARRFSGGLALSVSDNGAGFARDKLVEGVGLSNTRERLAVRFGPRARLELGSGRDGIGGRVSLFLPLEVAEAQP